MKQCYQNAIIALFLFCTIGAVSAQTDLPAEDIAEKALAATVYLEMKDANGKTLGIGSGFFVKPNIIATNYHVIEGAAKGTAKLVGKNTTYNIKGVTATDRTNDLALLQVPAYGIYGVKGIKPLALGDSDKVRIVETVYVAGNPKGLEGTFSDGIISSRRDKGTKERLQMTAPISPGSSGGPVLNRKGEVIGVSFMTLRGGQNLNFAMPSKYIKKLFEQAKPARPLLQGKQSISAETYFLWACIKQKKGNYEGAIADYTQAIRLKPDYVDAYFNRGTMKAMMGEYLASISDFDITIRLNPKDNDAYVGRGLAKASLGKYLAAIIDYDMAIRFNSNDADAYYHRGIAKGHLKQHSAAISDFDIAIRHNPNDSDVYYNRGVAKSQLGQHSAAISDFDIVIKLNPDYTKAYINRGLAKSQLGQYSTAISDYNTAIKLKPDYTEAYFVRGLAKYNLRKHSVAISDFDIVVKLNPDYVEAYFYRGSAKLKLNQDLAAISDFDIAIKLKPDYTKAYFIRGLTKYMLGRTLEAEQDLKKALKLAEKAGDTNLKTEIESLLQRVR